MASSVIFAELHMLSGERQDSSDLVGVATSPFLSLFKARRGQLFTVLEPSLPDAGDVCRRLIETIEDEYFRDSRTVTSSLKRAISVANEKLRAENSKASPDRQLRVGLSCAVVREGDVFVAQVAPANAFVLHQGAVKRVFSTYSIIPDASGNGTDRASDSLGARLEPQVNLSHSDLEEGDLVVLASGPYWKLIPERYILDAAKHLDPEMAASELYGCYIAHSRQPTTSLVVIRRSRLPTQGSSNGHHQRPGEDRTSRDLAELVLESEPLEDIPGGSAGNGRKKGSEGPPANSPASNFISRPPAGRREREIDGLRVDEVRSPDRAPAPPVRPAAKGRGHEEMVQFSAKPSLWDRLRGREPRPLYPKGPALEPVRTTSVKIRENWPQPRSERRTVSPWIARIVLTVILAAVFVGLANWGLALWTSWQLGDPVALAQEAQQKRSAAASAGTEATSRALLVQSLELFQRSLRAKDDEATRAAATSVMADIDRIDKTVRISQASVVVDYAPLIAQEEKTDVTRMVLDSNNLYVLDEGMDRLYKYTLTSDGRGVQEPGKHEVVVRRGDKLDLAPVGDLLSMTWMPAGQLRSDPALFTLESGRSLITYDPKMGLSRLDASESSRWGNIQAISGFAGGLYLADTKLKSIFYYPPTKNGYESQPYTIVDSKAKADLSKVVDIALDGNLYVLESTGAISRFTREGRPQDFDGALPDGGITDPKRLFASANTRSLYVVDGKGERIVQFSPEGKLQRQFKAEGSSVSFQEIRDIHVDEAARKMYVLARQSLFVFDMPPMQ